MIAAGRFNPSPQSPEAPRACVYALRIRNAPSLWSRAGAFLAIHPAMFGNASVGLPWQDDRESPMLNIKLGQTWERRSIPGAPWRRVRVETVRRDNVELRYLDLPGVPELEQVPSGSRTRMLSTEPSERRPASYRFVAE